GGGGRARPADRRGRGRGRARAADGRGRGLGRGRARGPGGAGGRSSPRGGGRIGPRRTCVGCRRVRRPAELVRIVWTPDGELAVGTGLPGRGAWLCAGSPDCLEEAVRRRVFSRALRQDVSGAAMGSLRM